jgi:large subunit ribosomal protein L2
MPLKEYKPYTKTRRHTSSADFSDLTRTTPEKSLTVGKRGTGGRNAHGHITSRFRGGGHKRALRLVDFRRDKPGIAAKVAHIEYDPNRSARLALLHYMDGEKRYIICPVGLKQGDMVVSGPGAEVKVGNAMLLQDVPPGVAIHNIELMPGEGAKLVRSAGQQAIVRSKEGEYAQVKLPSGEIRLIRLACMATIGQIGNLDHMKVSRGKAGKSRHLGIRPHVRGVCMNPNDHPHGGGEGRSGPAGHPKSPWGQLAKGFKTRKKKKASSRMIIERRKK